MNELTDEHDYDHDYELRLRAPRCVDLRICSR
jgi:hypothetical protein